MYCKHCGAKLDDEARFCTECGNETKVTVPAPKQEEKVTPKKANRDELPKGKYVSKNIVQDAQGNYHWVYEMSLLRNPTIFLLCWKIFFWIFTGMWIFFSLVELCGGYYSWDKFWDFTKVMMIYMQLGLIVMLILSMFVYGLIYGFKYCVKFEMTETGVTHTQLARQFKKAKAMSGILILAGLATHNLGRVGQGLLVGSHNSMSSSWKSVKSIVIRRSRNLIKVNETLNHNQVYAEKEDFDFVENFIREHVTSKCKIK